MFIDFYVFVFQQFSKYKLWSCYVIDICDTTIRHLLCLKKFIDLLKSKTKTRPCQSTEGHRMKRSALDRHLMWSYRSGKNFQKVQRNGSNLYVGVRVPEMEVPLVSLGRMFSLSLTELPHPWKRNVRNPHLKVLWRGRKQKIHVKDWEMCLVSRPKSYVLALFSSILPGLLA